MLYHLALSQKLIDYGSISKPSNVQYRPVKDFNIRESRPLKSNISQLLFFSPGNQSHVFYRKVLLLCGFPADGRPFKRQNSN